MQTANVVKIGIWIVIAVAILIFGTRYFQGLALGGTKTVVANFERVDGLIKGNSVQMRGVRIGNVADISMNPDWGVVEVKMSINRDVAIREGSVARLSGISALGDMKIEIEPGPADNPEVADGTTIQAATPIDLVEQAQQAAPEYMQTIDAILLKTDSTMGGLNQVMQDGGDVRATLQALRDVTENLNALLEAEAATLSSTMRNFESVSANLDTLTSPDDDSASVAVSLRRSLDQLDRTLDQTQSLAASLDSILIKMNAGHGTLGLLANDPSLYRHLDSAAVNLSRMLEDLRRDPKRYLSHVKAIDIF